MTEQEKLEALIAKGVKAEVAGAVEAATKPLLDALAQVRDKGFGESLFGAAQKGYSED